MQVWVSASWMPADQREPVERAFGGLGGLPDLEVEPREPGAERDADRAIPARVAERHGARSDVERGVAFALDPHVFDPGVGADGDLGDRVGEVAAVVQRDVVFDQRHAAARLAGDEDPRVARRARLGGDEQQVHGCRDRRVARHEDDCRIVQERGVQRSEQVVVERGVAAQMGLDDFGARRDGRRQVADHDAGAGRAGGTDAGESRRMDAVDEDEPDRCFVDAKALDVRGLQGLPAQRPDGTTAARVPKCR